MGESEGTIIRPQAGEWSARGLMGVYNAVMAARSFRFPRHLGPVARALMDDRIPKLLLIIGPGGGKSTLLSQIFPVTLLGHRPMETILGISAGESLTQGFVKAAMEIIEWSAAYHAIFPTRPNKDAGWSSTGGMYVSGRQPGDPDASYVGVGLDSKRLTGLHARNILLDDIHDKDNSVSITACDKVIRTYYSTILGRADPRGARFIAAGRRWHENDLYGHLASTGEYVVMELPAFRDGETETYFDVTIPHGLVCCFNDGSM